jgi:hypothetical protein
MLWWALKESNLPLPPCKSNDEDPPTSDDSKNPRSDNENE